MKSEINLEFSIAAPDLEHVLDKVGSRWEKFRDKDIFITGGTGFLGKWIIETLIFANDSLNLRCRVMVLTRSPDEFIKMSPHLARHKMVHLISGDVRDFNFPDGDFSYVIHAATDVAAQSDSLDIFSTCIDGTRRVLEFMRQANTSDFLLVSSGAIYGALPHGMKAVSEAYNGGPDVLNPKSAYAEGKRGSELLTSSYSQKDGFNFKIARCFAFVGPYLPLDKHFAIGNFIGNAISGEDLIIKGDGTPFRSYLYAADLAVWLWVILLDGKSGAAYNVGGKSKLSLAELAKKVVKVTGSQSDVNVLQQSSPNKVPETYVPDISKAEEELNLKVWISLDEAIRRTALWNNEVNRN